MANKFHRLKEMIFDEFATQIIGAILGLALWFGLVFMASKRGPDSESAPQQELPRTGSDRP